MDKPWKVYDLSKKEPVSRHCTYASAHQGMMRYCDEHQLIAELHVIRVYEPEKPPQEFTSNRMATILAKKLWKKTRTIILSR